MKRSRPSNNAAHLCTFAPLRVWARLVLENGVTIPYWGKLARILLGSVATLPLRVAETVFYSRIVARTEIREPPLFVMGFARSGTTHLHNLLSQDPDLGYVTTFQAAAPKWFLVGRGKIQSLMERGMGATTRPMDNMKIALDLPQEEEVALANSTHLSSLHYLSFSRKALEYFDRYVLLGDGSGLGRTELRHWEKQYLEILRKATINWSGRRIVLKTPVNLGRITSLLRMFPDAKFVHIVRDPFVIFQSMVHMHRKVLPLYRLQDIDWNGVEKFIVDSFVATMTRFIEDSKVIPRGNLVEVKFENLERDPVGALGKIYSGLRLPGWDVAQESVETYLARLGVYTKNQYELSRTEIELVRENWGFALDRWDYPVRDGTPDS